MEPRIAKIIAELEERARRERERPQEVTSRMWALHPDSARFLHVLIQATRATRLLEVGTSFAYSTLWLADATRPNGGRVITCEITPERAAAARETLARAGLEDVVEIIVGDARETLKELPGPFDFVFLDADKRDYSLYLDLVLPKLLPGSIVVADNILSHADAVTAYLERVRQDPALESVLVPIGSGLEVTLKIG
ncbi:MAG: O-methyltransferase [Chloroflexi bacterium]|nr:O-methyltransferase [Chloroflexota bacterium]